MARSIHHNVSFAGGEVSPKLDARVDQQKYNSWLRQSLNVVSYKSGGFTRRVGTEYIAGAKKTNTTGHNYAVRLVPFIFSPSTTFTLEFGDEYIRFYSNGSQVTVSSAPTWITATAYVVGDYVTHSAVIYYCLVAHTSGTFATDLANGDWVAQTIYEVPSPYGGDALTGSIYNTDVFQIVPCEVNDVVYIVHPDFPPYSLTRIADTDWVMKEVAFLSPTLLDQNATDTVLTPSALQGNGILITVTAPAWVAENYYTLANSVEVSGIIYDCIVANVSSSSFSTDLAAGYWQATGVFNPQHIGSSWQLAALRASAYIEYTGVSASGFAAGTSSLIQCLGNYVVHTYGTWSADIAVQRSLDGGITFDTVNAFTGRNDRNADVTGKAAQLGIYRIVVSNVAIPGTPGATNPRIVFECADAFLYGIVQITNVGTANATAMFIANTYQILTVGTTNWSAIGGRVNAEVGDIFVYNGVGVTGTGGTVTNPYLASANVITQLTDSNGLAAQWVSGTHYTAGQEVSYNFVNYTCSVNVPSPYTTPPSQDSSHWNQTQPGGTEYWSEGAWSDYRGYPQAVTSFQQRMIYASSAFEPQRIWGTVTNDIENFALGDQTLATDSFAFDLNAPGRGPIQWLIAQADLFAGFSAGEWVINSGSVNSAGGGTGSSITPTNINAVEQGTFGSAPFVQPAIVGNAVFFVQRQADAIRQMLFSVYTAKYMSQDLTGLADHLFASGIVQMSYQSRWRHQGMLWAATQQGTLCGLTYDLDQEVFGWCKAQTGYGQFTPAGAVINPDPGFESVAVLPAQSTSDDEVWVVADRWISGNTVRMIERINPNNWEEVFTGAPLPPAAVLGSAYYVDSGMTPRNLSSLTITGLDHLEGRYVVGLVDGVSVGPFLVTSGTITLPRSIPITWQTANIGLPIQYAGQPMRIDADAGAGNTQGRTKQYYELYLRVFNSCGGYVSNGTTNYNVWISGQAYSAGENVISPLTQSAYQCVTANSGTTDPSQSAQWVKEANPSYQAPVAIPYTKSLANPFAVAALVTVPTDIKVTPRLQPSIDTDPIIIVTANDALPITVLGLFAKYDLISSP